MQRQEGSVCCVPTAGNVVNRYEMITLLCKLDYGTPAANVPCWIQQRMIQGVYMIQILLKHILEMKQDASIHDTGIYIN